MATRARRRPAGKPRQILTILLLLIVALYAGIAGTTAWGSPKGKWTPQLGLDLEGGRQITLQPIVGKGQTVNAGEVDQAVDIIRNRVNGNGVSEAQVTTVNKKLIQVSLPGNPSEQTLKSLAQSSQLSFRPVITSQQVAPAQGTTPTPTGSPSTTPSSSPSSAAKSSSSPATGSATSTPKSSGANDIVPQAFKAETSTPSSTPSSSGTGSPSSTATSKSSGTSTPTPTPTPTQTTPARQLPGAHTPPANGSDDAWGDFPVDSIWVQNGLATSGETYTQLFQAFPCTQADAPKGKPAVKWQEIAAQAPESQPNVGCDDSTGTKYLMGPVEIQGKHLTDATYGQKTNQQGVATSEVVVNLKLDGTGTKQFAAVTERLTPYPDGNPKKQFAVTVDGKVITAPNSNSVITDGNAEISGNFTESSAKTLANQLKFGALPFSFKELTSNQVSPQVGTDQLQKGILAGLIGLVLVVLYSLLQYRALGFVTVASLVVAGVMSYGLVTLLGFTSGFRLTMAGVTGLIVSIGITADSFIVYFERVRDEVRSGRPLRASVETGWARARRTIIVSDAVNFLAAAVLYVLSEDNVKAFAFTLGLSTLVDIAVVMMFTHPVLTLLARTKFFGSGHKWSGFDPERLGAVGVTYAGRGRVTIADRKAAGEATAVEGGQA